MNEYIAYPVVIDHETKTVKSTTGREKVVYHQNAESALRIAGNLIPLVLGESIAIVFVKRI